MGLEILGLDTSGAIGVASLVVSALVLYVMYKTYRKEFPSVIEARITKLEISMEAEERRMRELEGSLHDVSTELKYLDADLSKFTSDTTRRLNELTERIDRIVEKRK